MITVRTAEAFARLLATHPDTDLKYLFQVQADRLADYDAFTFEELALIMVVEPTDNMTTLDAALGWSLLDGDTFAHPVELITLHRGWIEVTFILSDDGFGLVLYIQLDERTDKRLLNACKQALIEATQP